MTTLASPTLYKIRLLETEAELVASFRLRFQVYSAIGYVPHSLVSELEIDVHDAYAIPFGAFDLSTGELVGTIRLLADDPYEHYERLVHRIVEDRGDAQLSERVFGERRGLPSILSDEIAAEIDELNTDGFAVRELSRSITHPDHRGTGINRALMELGMAYAMHTAPVILVGGCQHAHVPLYERYGYERLPHAGTDHFAALGQDGSVVVCRTDRLPEPTRSHTRTLLRGLRRGEPGLTRPLAAGSQALFSYLPNPDAPRALARRRITRRRRAVVPTLLPDVMP